MKKLIEIELPFSGFYQSIHDDQIDQALESMLQDDNGDISEIDQDAIYSADVDWSAIRVEYCKRYTENFAAEFELDLVFTDMTSPREYNFSTDRIFATVPIAQINKIRRACESHEKWQEYINENFSDRSGFWSNYSNDYKHDDWQAPELDACQYETLLNFYILEVLEKDYFDFELYNLMVENVYEFASIDDALMAIDKYKTDNNLHPDPTESELQNVHGLSQEKLGL